MSTVEINFWQHKKIHLPPSCFSDINSIDKMKEQLKKEFGIDQKDLEIYHDDKIVNNDEEFKSLMKKSNLLVIKIKSDNFENDNEKEDDLNEQGQGEETCVAEHIFNDHKNGKNQCIWKDGIIPYVIDQNVSNDLTGMIQKAISEFHSKTFVKWNAKTNDHQNYVIFVQNNDKSPHSRVGCIGKGMQEISLCHPFYPKSKSKLRVACILHEMMHTLGFIHEHQRDDRDKHITMEEKALEDKPNYAIQGISLGQYDYTSLMHYADGVGFKCNNYELIFYADASETFSQGDLAGIRRIYGKEIYKNVKRPHFGEWHKGCTSNDCTDTACKCNSCGKLFNGLNCGYTGSKGHWTCCMKEDECNLECHLTHTGFWHRACDQKCTDEECSCSSCERGCTYKGDKGHWSCCDQEELNSECSSSPYNT